MDRFVDENEFCAVTPQIWQIGNNVNPIAIVSNTLNDRIR